MQGSVRDVQQLRDAHKRYVEACQAACWLQGAPDIKAAMAGVLQGAAALVDCIAAEGCASPECKTKPAHTWPSCKACCAMQWMRAYPT